MNLFPAFLIGFLGSFSHCTGMCGGIAYFWGMNPRGSVLSTQLQYNLGRTITYTCIGALLGLAGGFATGISDRIVGVQGLVAIAMGLVMILVAVNGLGWLRIPGLSSHGEMGSGIITRFFQRSGGLGQPFVGGLLLGFLPCGFLYAMAPMAVAAGNPVEGALVMGSFGLGTIPVMLAIGLTSGKVSPALKKRIYGAAMGLLLLFGIQMIGRGMGFSIIPGMDHCHHQVNHHPTSSTRPPTS